MLAIFAKHTNKQFCTVYETFRAVVLIVQVYPNELLDANEHMLNKHYQHPHNRHCVAKVYQCTTGGCAARAIATQ
eukprot:20399-Heterococcus_DN1.PRE.4